MKIFLYLFSIMAANIITAEVAPFMVWGLIIPAGSLLVGCTFILRDLTQMKYGRNKTYLVIFAALGMSALMAVVMGDGIQIAFASLAAFLVSEALDTEIFTRLKAKLEYKILGSGIVGGLLDSMIFVVLGLSPWGMGILDWHQSFYAILGQVITKTAMQFLGVGAYAKMRKMRA